MKRTVSKKLTLSKETVRTLGADQLQAVVGGREGILSLFGPHCVLTQQTCWDTCELKPYP